MENESQLTVYFRKLTIPTFIFLGVTTVLFFLLNFVVNLVVEIFTKTFLTGSLLAPEDIVWNLSMVYSLTYFETYSMMYIIVALASMLVGAFLVYKYTANYGRIEKNQKGSSRFATLKEIQSQYKQIPELNESFVGGGGVPVARYKSHIFIDDSAVNNLIIGTTRSGKGETFIFPTIDIYSRAEQKASMICNDPKGELFAASKDTLESLGYHVDVLNLMNPLQSMSYNLLQLTIDAFFEENYSLAQQYARSVAFMLYNDPTAKDKFWANSSTDLCTALILGLCEQCKHEREKINMYNVALMLSDLGTRTVLDEDDNEISALDEFFNRFPNNHPAKMQYATINFSGGQTRASILANTNAKLGVFTLDGTAKLTSQHSLDMTKFGFNHWLTGKTRALTRIEVCFPSGHVETMKTDSDGGFTLYHKEHLEIGGTFSIKCEGKETRFEVVGWQDEKQGTLIVAPSNEGVRLSTVMQFEKPIALFMIVPDYDPTFNVIASLYVKQVYTTLARTASNVQGGKCHREVIFILDEFGNMPPIDDLASILTVCLGRNIRFNLVIQAYSQIEKLYGNDWQTIDGNCNNTFYLLTSDFKTAETISKKLGEKTIVTKSRSGQTISLDKSKTENLDARALLNPTEVMGLREGEMIVIRTIKRQDNKRQRIKQFPLFLTDKTAMKYRWEYLSAYYDTDKSINNIEIPCTHANQNLNELKVDFTKKPEQPSDSIEMTFTNDLSTESVEKPLLEKSETVLVNTDEEIKQIKKENMKLRNDERKTVMAEECQFNEVLNEQVKVAHLFNDKYLVVAFKEHYEQYKDMGIIDFKEKLCLMQEQLSESNYIFMLEKVNVAIAQVQKEKIRSAKE